MAPKQTVERSLFIVKAIIHSTSDRLVAYCSENSAATLNKAIFAITNGDAKTQMKTIVLISCAAMKDSKRRKAKDLYLSALFMKSLAYALKLKPDNIFILSAKHYLLPLDKEIGPYDLSLNDFGVKELEHWAGKTIEQIKEVADVDNDRFIILAGNNYRRFLERYLNKADVPMRGLTIGKQLRFLNKRVK